MHEFRVQPDTRFSVSDVDPSDSSLCQGGKKAGQTELEKFKEQLRELQELLYAEGKHKVLIVLQALDAGGKDGTVRAVFDGVNPTGVRVASFKAPTETELAHDFLWRIHQQTPRRGEIVIFNRSHYEDVLAVRVRNLVPKDVWKRRYEHIRHFEQLLADEGTTILKFFLHISKDEQRERMQERIDDPTKRWKFRKDDLADRVLWSAYMAAFEDAISETSTRDAPWYVIPANRNWYRNWAVCQTIVAALEGLKMKYPEPEAGLSGMVIE